MLKKRLNGKTLSILSMMVMTVCLSVFVGFRSKAWTVNPSDFRYDMSLYFRLSDPVYEDLSMYEIGAFVGDECRGVAEKLELSEGGTCLYMRIRSNNPSGEEEVTFRLLDKTTDEAFILKGNESFMFKPDQMIGLPSDPYVLTPYFNIKIIVGDHGTVDFEDGLYAAGTVLKVIAVPELGYHLDSWSDGNKNPEREITVNSDIELSVSFAITVYSAVFKIDGEVFETQRVAYGDEIVVPEAPEKEGYTFSGWGEVPATMPAQDLEFDGTYEVNYYRLTVYLNEEIYMDEELAYGTKIEIADPELEEGYTFDGWKEEIPETMPAHDVVIYGTTTGSSAIGDIFFEDKECLTISKLNGMVVYDHVKGNEVKGRLNSGIYIINGRKVVIKK